MEPVAWSEKRSENLTQQMENAASHSCVQDALTEEAYFSAPRHTNRLVCEPSDKVHLTQICRSDKAKSASQSVPHVIALKDGLGQTPAPVCRSGFWQQSLVILTTVFSLI
ncbi:MAG: hypothetical protein SGJ27_15205 [Candidatus Melainabacteria bacterium]|nr:hypothetical protein [Candidatus Melainabacteria bacterium]